MSLPRDARRPATNPMPKPPSNSLLGLDLRELTDLALSPGQPATGSAVIDAALIGKRLTGWISLTPSVEYRAGLAEQAGGGAPRSLTSLFRSMPARYLIELSDGETSKQSGCRRETRRDRRRKRSGDEIEAASMRKRVRGFARGTGRARHYPCIGLPFACRAKWMRGELQVLLHRAAWREAESGGGEIVGQIAAVLRDQGVELRCSASTLCSWAWASPFEL